MRTDDTTAYVTRTTGPTDPGQGPFDPNVCQLGIDACANTWYGANPIAAALCAIFVLPNFSIGTSASIACTTGDSQNVADVNGDGKADFVRATGFQRDVQQVTMLNEASGMGDTVSGLQYAGDSAAILGLEWQIVTDGNGNQTAVLTGAAAPSFDRAAYDHAIASKPYFSNQPNFGAGRTHFAAGSYAISIPYVPAGAQRYYVDVNGDGRSDFVRYQGGNWLVSLSNGSGFSPPTLWNAPQGSGIKPFRMWADFNGDGKVDLIRLLDNGRISVALSNGAGFASDVITALDGAGVSLQLADVDGDGNLDFVRFKPNQLLFNRGKPGGGFESDTIIQTIDTGYDDFQYMVDVNGDGLADYVRILGANRETLAVSFSNGQGFVDTTYSSIPAGPASSTRPALADMNGDGHPDFVCFQPGGSGFVPVVYLFQNEHFISSYEISGASFPSIPAGALPQYVDTNGDGAAEILFSGSDTRFNMISRPATRPGLLTSIADGNGKKEQITLVPALNAGVIPSGGSSYGSYSVLGNTSPAFIVTSIEIDGASGPKSRTDFTYSGGRAKIGPTKRDSRPLGFDSLTTRGFVYSAGSWQSAGTYQVQHFHQNHPSLGFDGAGLPIDSVVYRSSDDSVISRTTHTCGTPPGYSVPGTIKMAVLMTVTDDTSTSVPVRSRRTFLNSDSLGNPTQVLDEPDVSSSGSSKLTDLSYEYPAEQPQGQPVFERITSGGQPVSCKQFTYDGSGNVTTRASGTTCSASVATTMTYNAVGKVVTMTENSLTTEMTYDSGTQNFAVSVKAPGGLVSSRDYDTATGLVQSETGPDGISTVYSYDSYGRRTTVKRGGFLAGFLGTTLEDTTYNLDGDGSGNVRTDQAFDDFHTISSMTVRDEWGQVLQSQREGASGMVATDHTYDALGRLLNETLPHPAGGSSPGSIVYSYDDLSRQTMVQIPNSTGTLTLASDPANLDVAAFTSAGGVSLRGFAVKETRPNGQEIYQYKSADGRVVQLEYQTSFAPVGSPYSVQAGWTRVRYHYDPAGKIVAVTRGSGITRSGIADNSAQTITIEYDDLGRRTAVNEPDKGRTAFTYNAQGQMECTTLPDETTCQSYDAAGRPIELRKDSPGGPVLVTYTYDSGDNGAGKLASITDESGTQSYDYDAITGQVTRSKRTYTHGSNTKHFDTVDSYSSGGLLLARSFPAVNMKVTYTYYPGGQVKSIKLADPDKHVLASGSELILATYGAPDAMGTIPSAQYSNGVRINYAYEPTTGKMTGLKAESDQAGQIADYSYTVTDEGLLAAITDNLELDGVDLSEQFTYDIARRLTKAIGPYGDRQSPIKTLNYTYGPDGQPLVFGDHTMSYQPNPHRLDDSAGIRYQYDNTRGNVQMRTKPSGANKNFTYTYNNRIKSVHLSGAEGTGDVNFTYDSDGTRFLKRYQANGVDLFTYTMAPDYQIRRVSGEEIHTMVVNKSDGELASLSFNSLYLISNASAPASLYKDRLLSSLHEIRNLSAKNIATKGPTIASSVWVNSREILYAYEWRFDVLWQLTLIVLSVATLVILLRLWQSSAQEESSWFPLPVRLTAVLMTVAFLNLTACVGVSSGPNDSNEIPAAVLAAGASLFQPGGNPDGSAMSSEMDGLVGVHFYITNQVSSNHLVTDTNGKLVCKYVYEPYGKMNMNLTDTDPDKDGVQFIALKKFTGQEYDYETGLYNYNARLYDQETGRFLQPDPVHSEHVGYDNYDRYQYVHSNPVNFTDPTGETAEILSSQPIGDFALLYLVLRNSHLGGQGQPYIYSNYTGPGANYPTSPKKQELMVLIASMTFLMGQAVNGDPAAQALLPFVAYYFYWANFVRSPPGGSEVDEASKLHDRDAPRFTRASSSQGNNKWIRRAWSHWEGGTPIPTKKMWNQTYAREYQRTSDDWGDARKPIATLRTGLRLGAEYLVTLIGTALFTYVNEWNYVNEARKRFIHHVGNSHSYRIHRARFKVKLGIWMEAGP